jgi:hypothetical protein
MWSRECLGRRRLGQLRSPQTETSAWNRRLNRVERRIIWKFNVDDARRKFKLVVDKPSMKD